MEQLLRSEEVSEIGEHYDLNAPVLFFPVRHHSPVCSFHLKKAIEDYSPDCILIEGPKNAGSADPNADPQGHEAASGIVLFLQGQRGGYQSRKGGI